MLSRKPGIAMILAAAGLVLSGCADVSDGSADGGDKSATLVEVPGSDVQQVVLTEKAVERLDIQMQPIVEQTGSQVVPYASVVYDPNGATWVYTSPSPLTFVRTPITVTAITGPQAILSGGPGPGTPVVTVGTAELFGVENEIGH